MPASQAWGGAHPFPQPPQFSGSLAVFAQEGACALGVPGQVTAAVQYAGVPSQGRWPNGQQIEVGAAQVTPHRPVPSQV